MNISIALVARSSRVYLRSSRRLLATATPTATPDADAVAAAKKKEEEAKALKRAKDVEEGTANFQVRVSKIDAKGLHTSTSLSCISARAVMDES